MLSSPADGMQVGRYSEGSLLVEMDYIIQGSCFKFLRAPSHMKQNVHFDTFFIKIGQKWEGAAQTTELEKGIQGGLKITICVIIWILHPFLPMLKLICMFSSSRHPFCKVSWTRTLADFDEKCVKILRAIFCFIWAGALSSLKHHLFIAHLYYYCSEQFLLQKSHMLI